MAKILIGRRLHSSTDSVEVLVPPSHPAILVRSAEKLVPETFDHIDLIRNGQGQLQTVEYRLAGALQATLTLVYTDGQLSSVTRT